MHSVIFTPLIIVYYIQYNSMTGFCSCHFNDSHLPSEAPSEHTMWVMLAWEHALWNKQCTTSVDQRSLVSTLWPEREQLHNWNPLDDSSHVMERNGWLMEFFFFFVCAWRWMVRLHKVNFYDGSFHLKCDSLEKQAGPKTKSKHMADE